MINKLLQDSFSINDKIQEKSPCKQSHGFWAKTEIIGGYGCHTNNKGISELDEVVFTTSNMVPIGGVQYAMEMIFGTTGPLTIPTLNAQGIGASTDRNGENMPYAYGQKVCLFAIGSDGAETNNLTAKEVKYNETEVSGIIPFRYTNDTLSSSDADKYYGKKTISLNGANTTAYYLKRFDTGYPQIFHLYKDGEEYEDGSTVDDSVFTNPKNTAIESFAECRLTITKKDAREWFAVNGSVEQCRINSIALYTAIYNSNEKDYSNIQLFSKLNIPTEPLSLTKDMTILYRVYGA